MDDDLASALMQHLPPEFWKRNRLEDAQSGLLPLPPLANALAGAPDEVRLQGKGAAKRELKDQLWEAAKRAYERALTPPPSDPNERFKASFGVDPTLPWLEFHDQAMRNFMHRARGAIPGINLGIAAYNSYYDPEHPVTQEKQNTKDAAMQAGLAAFEVGMPWLSARWGRSSAVPPEMSKHPAQRSENFKYAAPGVMAALLYGIRPSK